MAAMVIVIVNGLGEIHRFVGGGYLIQQMAFSNDDLHLGLLLSVSHYSLYTSFVLGRHIL
jgi:hypothetical protein